MWLAEFSLISLPRVKKLISHVPLSKNNSCERHVMYGVEPSFGSCAASYYFADEFHDLIPPAGNVGPLIGQSRNGAT